MDALTLFPVESSVPFAQGSPTSKQAARAFAKDLARIEREVLVYLVSRGEAGATYREAMHATGLCSGTICGRFADLKAKGLAVATVRRRGKCGVVVAREFYRGAIP